MRSAWPTWRPYSSIMSRTSRRTFGWLPVVVTDVRRALESAVRDRLGDQRLALRDGLGEQRLQGRRRVVVLHPDVPVRVVPVGVLERRERGPPVELPAERDRLDHGEVLEQAAEGERRRAERAADARVVESAALPQQVAAHPVQGADQRLGLGAREGRFGVDSHAPDPRTGHGQPRAGRARPPGRHAGRRAAARAGARRAPASSSGAGPVASRRSRPAPSRSAV